MSSPARGFEVAGVAAGWALAPWFALISSLRRARTFHPRGTSFLALCERHSAAPVELFSLADRLVGRALIRFSGALWKDSERLPDVLGCALRFCREDRETAESDGDDQDLLLATIHRPWTMGFAPWTTRTRDYLANDYFGVSPFDVGLAQQVYFRLRPERQTIVRAGHRAEKLVHDVQQGLSLRLDVSHGPWGKWTPLLDLSLERPARVDDDALRFSPFRMGRGVRPRGFVHSLRLGVYAASQAARPTRRRD